jgi:hypothetical protein
MAAKQVLLGGWEQQLPKVPDTSFQQQISITTMGHGDMHDITDQVASAVAESG